MSPKAFGLTPAYPENDTVRDDVIGDKSPLTLELLKALFLLNQTAKSRNSRSHELITRLKFSCSARLTAT